MARFAVWGCGKSSSKLVQEGEFSEVAFDVARWKETSARDAGERHDARGNLHEWGQFDRLYDNEWVVEVECDESDLDAQTRYDHATVGYASIDTLVAEIAADAIELCAEQIGVTSADVEQYIRQQRPLDAGHAWDKRRAEIAIRLASEADTDPDSVGATAILDIRATKSGPLSDALHAEVIEYLEP